MNGTVDPAWHAIESFVLTFATGWICVMLIALFIELWQERPYVVGLDDWGEAGAPPPHPMSQHLNKHGNPKRALSAQEAKLLRAENPKLAIYTCEVCGQLHVGKPHPWKQKHKAPPLTQRIGPIQ